MASGEGRSCRDLHADFARRRSEEHTSELQSQSNLVCRLLLEKKKTVHLCCECKPRDVRSPRWLRRTSRTCCHSTPSGTTSVCHFSSCPVVISLLSSTHPSAL